MAVGVMPSISDTGGRVLRDLPVGVEAGAVVASVTVSALRELLPQAADTLGAAVALGVRPVAA